MSFHSEGSAPSQPSWGNGPSNIPPSSERMLDHALAYAARGWYVFPIKPGQKYPPLCKWREESTRDESTIWALWTRTPDANIGIDCGKSGICVLDIDVNEYIDKKTGEHCRKHGAESLTTLCTEDEAFAAAVAAAPRVRTRSGGWHCYLQGTTPSKNDHIAPNIDIKSEGGCVVAPPSIVYEDGETGSYTWEVE